MGGYVVLVDSHKALTFFLCSLGDEFLEATFVARGLCSQPTFALSTQQTHEVLGLTFSPVLRWAVTANILADEFVVAMVDLSMMRLADEHNILRPKGMVVLYELLVPALIVVLTVQHIEKHFLTGHVMSMEDIRLCGTVNLLTAPSLKALHRHTGHVTTLLRLRA
jgi:hypothetical protein